MSNKKELKLKNNLISNRVEKLISYKSNSFKKKFKLLSFLSEAKLNKENISEADCYLNTLIESNGNKPSFKYLTEFVKNNIGDEALVDTLTEFLNLKYKENLEQKIINESLDAIVTDVDLKINDKLYETLNYSLHNRKSIFFEAEDPNLLLQNQNAENKEEGADELRSHLKDKSSSQSPANSGRVKGGKFGRFETPKSGGINRELSNQIEKKFNSLTNAGKRKFEIIEEIKNHLFVFLRFNPPQDKNFNSYNDTGKYSTRSSGLSDEEVQRCWMKLDRLLSVNPQKELDLDSDDIREDELLALLRESMGKGEQSDLYFKDRVEELKSKYPLGKEDLDNYLTPSRQRDKDALNKYAHISDEMSDEEAEAEENRLLGLEAEEDRLQDERNSQIPYDYKEEPNREVVEVQDMTQEEIAALPPDVVLKFVINCDKRDRKDIYNKLIQNSASPEKMADFVKTFYKGKLFSDGSEDLGDKKKGVNLTDLALMSGGTQKHSGSARQDLMKFWFRSIFFASDIDKRANIFANLGDRWIEGMRMLDLVSDNSIKIDDPKIKRDPGFEDYLEKISDIITVKNNMKSYLDGSLEVSLIDDLTSGNEEYLDDIDELDIENNPDMEQVQILHTLFSSKSSFKIFSSLILSDYYDENIWYSLENELAFAIKTYFNKIHPSFGIDKSNLLKPGKKSGVVKKEEGRILFNMLIYWVMGRTGSTGKETESSAIEEKRKDYLRKNIPKRISEFNIDYPSARINMSAKEIEALLTDMTSDTGIIGSVYAAKRTMTTDIENSVIDYILGMSSQVIKKYLSRSLIYKDLYNKFEKKQLIFNTETEKLAEKLGNFVLDNYTKEFKEELKKQAELMSDEYGYEV